MPPEATTGGSRNTIGTALSHCRIHVRTAHLNHAALIPPGHCSLRLHVHVHLRANRSLKHCQQQAGLGQDMTSGLLNISSYWRVFRGG